MFNSRCLMALIWDYETILANNLTQHLECVIVCKFVLCSGSCDAQIVFNLLYKFTCLLVCDMPFCCIIIFYASAAESTIGKSIFVWNWHPRETRLISTQLFVRPFVRSSVTGRSDPLTVSAMLILQPPRNEPQRPILRCICFFFYLFFLD